MNKNKFASPEKSGSGNAQHTGASLIISSLSANPTAPVNHANAAGSPNKLSGQNLVASRKSPLAAQEPVSSISSIQQQSPKMQIHTKSKAAVSGLGSNYPEAGWDVRDESANDKGSKKNNNSLSPNVSKSS